MKILFSTFGSLGDIHPYLALSLEAKARGHSPVIATSKRYCSKIEALGIEFRAIAPDLPPEDEFGALAKRVMNEADGPRFLFEEILSPSIRAQYADLLGASEDADLLVTHPAVMAGPLVARKLKKKWLSSVLSPISLWSRRDPAVLPSAASLDFLRAFGPVWGVVQVFAGRKATKPWLREVERLRVEQNIQDAGHPMFEGQYSPMGTLALFSRHFCAPQRDWPANTTATGFCFYDALGLGTQSEANGWRAWMNEDQKPVVVWTLGSAAVHDAGQFYGFGSGLPQKWRDEEFDPIRSLLLTGGTQPNDELLFNEELDANDPDVFALDYAPYSEIFPRAACVVHQGGVGTTAQALRAGVPQIVVPYAHDQSDNAARLKRLRVATSVRRQTMQNAFNGAEELYGAVFEALSFKQRAREIGERIREENGARAACEVIEQTLATV